MAKDKNRPVGKEQIKRQLKGIARGSNKPCTHPNKHVETNRAGKGFWECNNCGAFLGWK